MKSLLLTLLLAGCSTPPSYDVSDGELDRESARVVRLRQEMRGELPKMQKRE